MIEGRNFLDQRITNDFKTYDRIRKTVKGQSDDYTTECVLKNTVN